MKVSILGPVTAAIGLGLFTGSLQTVAVCAGDCYTGARLLLWSPLVIISSPLLGIAFLANVLLVPSWLFAALTLGDIAAVLSGLALPFALSSLFVHELTNPVSPGTYVVHFQPGFALWLASTGATLAGSLVMVLRGSTSMRFLRERSHDGSAESPDGEPC